MGFLMRDLEHEMEITARRNTTEAMHHYTVRKINIDNAPLSKIVRTR